MFSFSFVIQLFVGGAALPVPIVASWHRLALSANVLVLVVTSLYTHTLIHGLGSVLMPMSGRSQQ